jgi:hypothetical protein
LIKNSLSDGCDALSAREGEGVETGMCVDMVHRPKIFGYACRRMQQVLDRNETLAGENSYTMRIFATAEQNKKTI